MDDVLSFTSGARSEDIVFFVHTDYIQVTAHSHPVVIYMQLHNILYLLFLPVDLHGITK